eukprot:GHVQ01040068.1.p1 GENE.GHVQ01040068.1~~GHVQ01040068.1.p1  ORF type:complete len:611 (+),score=59.32 GHVQ01040068.1:788-2620(+)
MIDIVASPKLFAQEYQKMHSLCREFDTENTETDIGGLLTFACNLFVRLQLLSETLDLDVFKTKQSCHKLALGDTDIDKLRICLNRLKTETRLDFDETMRLLLKVRRIIKRSRHFVNAKRYGVDVNAALTEFHLARVSSALSAEMPSFSSRQLEFLKPLLSDDGGAVRQWLKTQAFSFTFHLSCLCLNNIKTLKSWLGSLGSFDSSIQCNANTSQGISSSPNMSESGFEESLAGLFTTGLDRQLCSEFSPMIGSDERLNTLQCLTLTRVASKHLTDCLHKAIGQRCAVDADASANDEHSKAVVTRYLRYILSSFDSNGSFGDVQNHVANKVVGSLGFVLDLSVPYYSGRPVVKAVSNFSKIILYGACLGFTDSECEVLWEVDYLRQHDGPLRYVFREMKKPLTGVEKEFLHDIVELYYTYKLSDTSNEAHQGGGQEHSHSPLSEGEEARRRFFSVNPSCQRTQAVSTLAIQAASRAKWLENSSDDIGHVASDFLTAIIEFTTEAVGEFLNEADPKVELADGNDDDARMFDEFTKKRQCWQTETRGKDNESSELLVRNKAAAYAALWILSNQNGDSTWLDSRNHLLQAQETVFRFGIGPCAQRDRHDLQIQP